MLGLVVALLGGVVVRWIHGKGCREKYALSRGLLEVRMKGGMG